MKHVADASYSSHQPAFQIAFQDRKRIREEVFNKGVSEGIRRQKEENRVLADDIDRYRCERNQAREELCTLRAQLDATRAESERLQDKLSRQQIALPVDVSNPQCELRVIEPPVDHQLSLDYLSPLYPQQLSPPMTTPVSPQAQLPDCVAARSFAAVLATGQPDDDSAFQATSSDDTPPTLSWTVVASPTYKPTKPAKNIKQVQSLIKAAHQPGNYSALTKVKALCSEAHKTPRDQKTEVQRYLLSNWRTPDWEHPSSLPKLPAPLNNPRLEDPVECWVSYYAANPSSCPKGIRRESDGRPVLSDMKASRTVARLRPMVNPSDPESREARQKYMTVVTELFSERGEYSSILRRDAFSVSPHVSYAPFVGTTDDIDRLSIARHFAACGVTIPIAEDELAPWAMEYLRD
ncbi:hypothetical protein BDR07DRAFT_1431813 [Suillus spraguei]|nr:hypothetical protein BDR07DRAFT_1431813 [Suillus spraguei]